MVETIGKKLCQARLARGISLEEAAYATRVRPEKLIALENDDYGRFGGNAYAKGFLQIYGRYLGVDVSQEVKALEVPRHVTVSDYQYLNNAPEPEPTRIQIRRQSNRPSLAPLLIMIGLLLAGFFTLVGFMFNVTMERLEPKQDVANRAASPATQTAPAAVSASQESGAATATAPVPTPTPTPVIRDSDFVSAPSPQPVANNGSMQSGAVGTLPVPSALDQPATTTQPATPTPVSNEIVLKPLKKTWVKIRRDSPTSAPIFEDYLYPNSRPLKLHGTKFFVEIRDQDAVEIQKNGHPIAYQAPGISIQ